MEKTKKRKRESIFLTGLAAFLPTLITLYILYVLFSFVNEEFGHPINSFFKSLMMTETGKSIFVKVFKIDEKTAQDETLYKNAVDKKFPTLAGGIVAFIIALFMFFTAGVLLASFIGKKIYKYLEYQVNRVPLISWIYSTSKQITDFFFEPRAVNYENKRPVLVEYPREGMYSLGFITGEGFASARQKTGKELVNVFILNTPAPLNGYVIQIPYEELFILPFSIEDAVKCTVSGGVVVPDYLKGVKTITGISKL